MRIFWPPAEAAQVDYESLRAAVLAGTPLASAIAVRFANCGLPGVIAHPVAEPVFSVALVGAERPAWTPYADPRLDVLASSYALLLAASTTAQGRVEEEAQ